MERGSGLRHGSITASRRPSPHTVPAHAGDDPRLRGRLQAEAPPRLSRRAPVRDGRAGQLSPFVLHAIDSESVHADPSRASLAISDRLARDQPDRALHPGRWPLRTLSAPAWSARRAAHRIRTPLVGHPRGHVARQPWPSCETPTRLHPARGDPDDAQTRLSRDRPPQPRSDLQRAQMAEPGGALSALPHDPRRGRAPPAPLVERLSTPCPRRSLYRTVQLSGDPSAAANRCTAAARDGRRRCHVTGAAGLLANARSWSSARIMIDRASEARTRWPVRLTCAGASSDRNPPKPQDDRNGATAAGR